MFSFIKLNKAQMVLFSLLFGTENIILVLGTIEFPCNHHFDLGWNEDVGLGIRNSQLTNAHNT